MPSHIYVCSSISSRVSASPPCYLRFFHDHPSTSAPASLLQTVPSHASTLPVSSSRIIDRPPTFTSSSAFPVGSSRVFTSPSLHVPGNPDFSRTALCDPVAYPNANTFPAHLHTTGPVYTHATKALSSVGSTNYTTVFCNTSAGAQTPSPLVEDPRHVLLLFSQWVNVFSQPLLPRWRK